MTRTYFILLMTAFGLVNGQVGIDTATPDPSAILDLSQSSKAGGLKLPTVALQSTIDITTIPNPATGLMVFTTVNAGTGINAVTAGSIYKFNGTFWKKLSTKDETLTGNVPKVVAFGKKQQSRAVAESILPIFLLMRSVTQHYLQIQERLRLHKVDITVFLYIASNICKRIRISLTTRHLLFLQ